MSDRPKPLAPPCRAVHHRPVPHTFASRPADAPPKADPMAGLASIHRQRVEIAEEYEPVPLRPGEVVVTLDEVIRPLEAEPTVESETRRLGRNPLAELLRDADWLRWFR